MNFKTCTAAILTIGLLTASSYAIDLGNGLVAHLPLNNSAVDITGNGYDGTVYGAMASADRFGNPNGAYSFDGVDDYIDLGTMGGFQSVSMWVRQETRSGFDFYFGHNDFRFFASTADNGRLTLGDAGGRIITPTSMDGQTGNWVHIVGISDGAQSKVYFNGVNVTSIPYTMITVDNYAVNLGRWSGPVPPPTHQLNGGIDDVRIYDRVLSEAEIAALYAIPEPATSGLMALCAACGLFIRRGFRIG